jgi:hypothetical protein
MGLAFRSIAPLQQETAIAERDRLVSYFANPVGYAWRASFVEPSLDDLSGLGPELLSFDHL